MHNQEQGSAGLANGPPATKLAGSSAANGTSCLRFLAQLTQSELEDLAAYARFRLSRVGLPPQLAEDVRQSALLSVLRGSENARSGRHPLPAHLGDLPSFISYLRSIIASLVEARSRARGKNPDWVHIEAVDLPSPLPDAGEQVASDDLAAQLFARLFGRAPYRLAPVVTVWAERWRESDQIPLDGRHRRHRQALRKLAAKIINELSTPGKRGPHFQPQENYETTQNQ